MNMEVFGTIRLIPRDLDTKPGQDRHKDYFAPENLWVAAGPAEKLGQNKSGNLAVNLG